MIILDVYKRQIEHPDFEDYFQSKMKMFEKSKIAVVNLDADYIDQILEASKAAGEVVTFSTKNPEADYYAYNIYKEGKDIRFSVKCEAFDEEFVLTMPGFFNAVSYTHLDVYKRQIHVWMLEQPVSNI